MESRKYCQNCGSMEPTQIVRLKREDGKDDSVELRLCEKCRKYVTGLEERDGEMKDDKG